MSDFAITIPDESTQQRANQGGQSLLTLCQKEADAFSDFLDRYGRDSKDPAAAMFIGGLADWERRAVAGYLYQKFLKRF